VRQLYSHWGLVRVSLSALIPKNVIQSGVFAEKKKYCVTLNATIALRVQINNYLIKFKINKIL
jgi:hypothetical protein